MFLRNGVQKWWRIQDSPGQGPNHKSVGVNLLFWPFSPESSMKLKQNGPGGHVSVVPPLGSANENLDYLTAFYHTEGTYSTRILLIVSTNLHLMACSHCTGPGTDQGMGNDWFLYYTMYCTYYTGTGTGTGAANHCFPLCPSQSLFRSGSRGVCMSHYAHSISIHLFIWDPSPNILYFFTPTLLVPLVTVWNSF